MYGCRCTRGPRNPRETRGALSVVTPPVFARSPKDAFFRSLRNRSWFSRAAGPRVSAADAREQGGPRPPQPERRRAYPGLCAVVGGPPAEMVREDALDGAAIRRRVAAPTQLCRDVAGCFERGAQGEAETIRSNRIEAHGGVAD